MLTFFRRIRKGLIASGATRKYLLYAIGEIALVVIGIMIALQINNWNEFKRARIEEKSYLKRLKIELEKDTTYLTLRLDIAKSEKYAHQEFLNKMYERQNSVSEFKAIYSMGQYETASLLLADNTYQEMTSSGKFDLFLDDRIKDMILNYYKVYNEAAAHISEMSLTGIDMMLQVLPLTIKYRYEVDPLFQDQYKFHDTQWKWINEPNSMMFRKVEGIASFYFLKQQVFEKYYSDLKQRAKYLIFEIDEF